jgi:hypothetical protein
MTDFAEIWGTASDQATNNLSFESTQIHPGVFEIEDFPQN